MEDLSLQMHDKMFAHVEQCLTKDQKIRSYCLEHNIKEHVFHYWYGKYRRLQKGPLEQEGFVEVSLPNTRCSLEVSIPTGCRCHFINLPPADYLRKLLGV